MLQNSSITEELDWQMLFILDTKKVYNSSNSKKIFFLKLPLKNTNQSQHHGESFQGSLLCTHETLKVKMLFQTHEEYWDERNTVLNLYWKKK